MRMRVSISWGIGTTRARAERQTNYERFKGVEDWTPSDLGEDASAPSVALWLKVAVTLPQCIAPGDDWWGWAVNRLGLSVIQ